MKSNAYIQIIKTGQKFDTQYRDTSVFINSDYVNSKDLTKFCARNPWVSTFLISSPLSNSKQPKISVPITIDASLDGVYLEPNVQKDISKLCKHFLLWLFHAYNNGEDIEHDDAYYQTLYFYWYNAKKEIQSYRASYPEKCFKKEFDFWITLVLITEDLFYEYLNEYDEYDIDVSPYKKSGDL